MKKYLGIKVTKTKVARSPTRREATSCTSLNIFFWSSSATTNLLFLHCTVNLKGGNVFKMNLK